MSSNYTGPAVSYLLYPNFDRDAHPPLSGSLLVDLQQLRVKYRDYLADSNRPILHRKELLVTEAYPLRRKFAGLTQQEEKRGLYENPERIGFEVGWQELLRERGLRIVGHRLVRASQS